MDSEIELVTPFSVNDGALVRSLASSLSFDSPVKPLSIKVPVSRTFDYEEIIKNNDDKTMKGHKQLETAAQTQISEEELDENLEPEHMTEINQLIPRNFHQQVCTVIIRNFPNLKPVFVEKVLNLVISDYSWCPVATNALFFVVLRANSLIDLKSLHENKSVIESLKDTVSVVFDENCTQSLADISESVEVEPTQATSTAQAIANNPKTHNESSADGTGTEDLDQVLQYYNSYAIDPTELVEVPKDMKEKIKRAIIRFRSRVVIMEKNKRKQEIVNERLKSKHLIAKIIQDTNISKKSDSDDIMTLDEPEEELQDMTDEQYEEHLKQTELQRYDRNYNAELQRLNQKERERADLLEKLEALKNYEANLMDNKSRQIEQLRKFEDYSTNNTFSQLNLHYSNYPEYVRTRNQKRQREEELDELDRQRERQEIEVQKQSNQFMSKFVIQKPKSIEVSGLSKENKDKLKVKVGDLIEEYLGIREDVLIEFIITFLENNELKNKDVLINDLSETLDEDSNVVVGEIHEFIKQLNQ